MAFTLPDLPYAFDALEPAIDARTMEIHHDKHHQTYVDNLNAALAKHPECESLSLTELVTGLQRLPEDIRTAVRNNAGGHYNHSLFWKMMTPAAQSRLGGAIEQAITERFGSFDAFKQEFTDAAKSRFGSGWAWLVWADGKLQVVSTANQDNPLMDGQIPLLGLDVWEHAYYLKYQNKRPDYIAAFFSVVNWDYVNELFAQAQQ